MWTGIAIGVAGTLLVELIVAVWYGIRTARRQAASAMMSSVERTGETIHAVLTNEKGDKHVVT